MVTEFKLAEITVEVNEKDIKNVHLSVNPPDGKVRIAIPLGMNLDTVRSFALSKLSWIRQQRKQFVEQEREIAREFLELESHFVFGKRYLLRFVDQEAAPSIRLSHDNLTIGVRPGTTREKIQDALEQWYRDLLRHEALEIIKKWEPTLNVKVQRLYIQHMKTHWGSAMPSNSSIRINSNLARKPLIYLEYVILHEMVHLIHSSHSDEFYGTLDLNMPNWRDIRTELNRLPIPKGNLERGPEI